MRLSRTLAVLLVCVVHPFCARRIAGPFVESLKTRSRRLIGVVDSLPCDNATEPHVRLQPDLLFNPVKALATESLLSRPAIAWRPGAVRSRSRLRRLSTDWTHARSEQTRMAGRGGEDVAALSRRDELRLGAAIGIAASSSSVLADSSSLEALLSTPKTPLTKQQINQKLSRVPVLAIIDAGDSPYIMDGKTGYFYLDYKIAGIERKRIESKVNGAVARLSVNRLSDVYFPFVRGDRPTGAKFYLKADDTQLDTADNFCRIKFKRQDVGDDINPAKKLRGLGQVPLFSTPYVKMQNPAGELTDLIFFSLEDLDESYLTMAKNEYNQTIDANAHISPTAVDITTLDDLILGMLEGSRDYSSTEFVAPRAGVEAMKRLVEDGRIIDNTKPVAAPPPPPPPGVERF